MKKEHKFIDLLKKIFGSYTPPKWPSDLSNTVKTNKKVRKGIKIGLISLVCAAGALILVAVGLFSYRFISSKKPVEMEVSYYIYEPVLSSNPKDSLIINFYGSVAPLDDINQPINNISITPEIKGNWKWNGDDSIIFEPAENWKLGTKYIINFGKNLFAEHINVNTKSNQNIFYTEDFHLDIDNAEFIIDDFDPSKKYICFNLYSNFPIAEQDFSTLITIKPDMKNPKNGTVENRNYSCTVGFNENRQIAYVASELIGIPADDIDFDITVKEGVKNITGESLSKSKLTTYVTIPGYNNFVKIRNVDSGLLLNDNQEYDQIITIETSAKISINDFVPYLEFYKLPTDKPEEPGSKAIKNYSWYNTDYITDKVLSLSQKLAIKPYETETEYETVHSFYVDVPENSYIYVKIKEGAHFYGDYYLSNTNEYVINPKPYPKEMDFVSQGTLLSLNGSKNLPILTRGIPDLDIHVWRFKPEEVNHIVSQSNGNLNHFRFDSSYFDEDNVAEYIYGQNVKTYSKSPKSISYVNFDFNNYLNSIPSKDLRYGLFLVRLFRTDCSTVKKLVLVTDQTLIIKKDTNNNIDVFVQSISTGAPVSSSLIKVIGLNGDVLASGYTDKNGHLFIPKLNTNNNNCNPTAITATIGEDMAFVPYGLNGRYVDYSDFDVGGLYGAQDPDKLSAFIFNDRGIYRPGDEMHFGMIVKAGNWNRTLKGTPMAYVIKDPNGNDIFEKEFSLNEDGFEEVSYTTKDYSPTGIYNIYLYLKKKIPNKDQYERILIGSESAKVEEFMPDTLQISSSFEPLSTDGWIHPQKLTGVVKLKNLFGSDAVGNTVKADMQLVPGYIRFNKFKDYQFKDPFISKDTYTERLEDTKTDENGYARFDIYMERFAPASYRLILTSDGFEKESGRSVTSTSSIYVSPLDYLIGVKADGALNYINKDSKRMLKFIAVGPNLEAMKVDGVTLTLTENRYVSVLVKQPNGVYKYQSVKKEYPVLEKTISIPKDGLEYYLPVDTEGDFVLKLTDKNGNVFNSTDFSIVGSKNLQRSLSRTAEIEVKMAKSDFKKGEQAELLIKAPYAGSGLICVELDKVYSYKWFTTKDASTIQHISIPNDIEGNGYITIMFKRAYDSDEVYMSPFCYAAVPFSVSLDDRKNNIKLDVPYVVKPDTDYEIKYSSSKKGKIVLIAVDEGILQVAKYKTPEPLSFFFKKRALEVGSYQTLDLILPEFNVLKTLAAAGGGGDYEDYLSHNLNPFKKKQNAPVAYWSGIIDTDGNEHSVKYHIPSYFNGKLRVMAVAVSGDSIGVSETSTEVRDDYIIMPNCPNFAAPGDEFDVAVTVTNNDAGTGENAKVKLTAVTDKGLTPVGNASVDLTISEGRDATYTFRFKATNELGNSDIKFTAQGPKKGSKITSSLSIRPSMPYQVWLKSGMVRKDENKKDTVSVDRDLYNEFATREVNLSYLPLGLAKGLKFYLDNYPYGCSEQVTSAAFPYLYPDLLKECGKAQKDAKAAIENVINILQSRQKSDGTIGYWTQKSDSYPELDAYCALFLTIAKEEGYYVPQTMFNRLLNALKTNAVDSYNYSAAFSIYVLTRNEYVTTSYLEKLSKEVDNYDKMSLTGIYMAASYKLLQMDNEAKKIMNKVRKGIAKDLTIYRFESDLYYNASFLFLISEYFPEYLSVISGDLLSEIENRILDREYNSLSSAMSLIAITSYLNAVPTASTGKFTVSQNFGKDTEQKVISVDGEKIFAGNFEPKAKNLIFQNNEKTNLYYQVIQAGFMNSIPESETRDNGLEVTRVYSTSRDGKAANSFNIGDEVYVTVRIRSTNNNPIYNVALVDMLPSGFEADITSIRENDSEWTPEYIDIREDRVIFYGTATKDTKSFTYKAKAITNGNFIVPPLFAQAMYLNKVKAIKPYDKIEIKKAK